MAACYHPAVVFSDEVFINLEGERAAGMWQMLCERGKDLKIEFRDVQADDSGGRAHWEAWYTFSATGRRVHNKIDAEFVFRDGKIVRHRDSFNFWAWARQALGAKGWLLGWSGLVKKRVRSQAAKGLAAYVREHSKGKGAIPKLTAAVVAMLLALPGCVSAQTVVTQTTSESRSHCFSPRQLPECKSFWLTEVGYYRRAAGGGSFQSNSPAGRRPDLDNHFSWELGGMWNRSARTALGGTVLVGGGGGGSGLRFGVKGRYRHWTSKRGSVDISAGPLYAVTHSDYPQLRASGAGVSGDVSLNWKDWAAVTVRAEALRGGGRNAGAAYTGFRLGSYPAVFGMATMAAFLGLLTLAYSGEGT